MTRPTRTWWAMRSTSATASTRPGGFTPSTATSSRSAAEGGLLLPLADGIAADPHLRRPEAAPEAGFAPEVVEEIAGVGELLPDLRQEGAAVLLAFEDDAVDAGAEEPERLRLGSTGERRRRGEERDLDRDLPQLVRLDRREAGVVEGRGAGVAPDVLEQGPIGLDRAHTPT